MAALEDKRTETIKRIDDLKKDLTRAETLIAEKACVYATGSFGRLEARTFSDLDLFIVGRRNGRSSKDEIQGSMLRRLDEIRVKADIIEATKKRDIPDFDKDGMYFKHYSVDELVKKLGRPDDDYENTFTARLLLLLECSPIIGQDVYNEIIEDVIAPYWRDYQKHKDSFAPAFLCNDIIRLWRTFCVNYEARTELQPEHKRIERKTKNYKLKCSRMITCYSAILYLLAEYDERGTVSADKVTDMTRLTPTQRIEELSEAYTGSNAGAALNDVLEGYSLFLDHSNFPEESLVERFSDKSISEPAFKNAAAIGDSVFQAVMEIGKGKHLHRLLLV